MISPTMDWDVTCAEYRVYRWASIIKVRDLFVCEQCERIVQKAYLSAPCARTESTIAHMRLLYAKN